MATNWYWLEQKQERGPVSFHDLALMVQDHLLNEDDFVRPDYSPDWQYADQVVGLFYMAKRVARPRPEPTFETPAEVVLFDDSHETDDFGDEVTDEAVEEHAEFQTAGESHVTLPTDVALLADGSTVDDADATPLAENEEIAIAIADATEEWDRRHANPIPATEPVSDRPSPLRAIGAPVLWLAMSAEALLQVVISACFRLGALVGIGVLCQAIDRVASRQTLTHWFRFGAAVVCAALTWWGITNWSEYVTMRYPNPEWMASGRTVFPLLGPCRAWEYNFLLFDVMLATAVAGYFGARWMESMADD